MNFLKIFLLLFVFSFSLIAQTKSDERTNKFDPDRNPFEDLKTATQLATETNKRIILDVGGEWCIWCHRLDDFIESSETIKKKLDENFIVIKVNYSKENKNEEFLSKYPQIDGYPHFFVLEKDGKLLHSQNTGLLEKDKDYDPEKFIAFLNDWSPKKK